MIPRIVVAAPASGSGKTTVTLAIICALRRRGFQVAPFKVGPDYIDPQLHRRAAGRPSYNLDSHLTGRDGVLDSFARGSRDAGIAVIEGVMGLFDGASPEDDQGSTAEIARILEAPVALVIDAGGMGASIGAVALGFTALDPSTRVAGVIANRLGSDRHADFLRPSLARVPVRDLGYFLRDSAIRIPERHLGLLPPDESDRVTPLLDRLAEAAEATLDLDALIELASSAPPLALPSARFQMVSPRARIAWAEDEVFHFSYQENKDLLRESGAEIVPFSPLRDRGLPGGTDALWLGGGFPENFAKELAGNATMVESIRAFARSGRPIYAECGGFMYLCEWFEDRSGVRVPLVGLVPGGTRMTDRLQRFGYAEATFLRDTPLGAAGTVLRGHRFHHSEYVPPGDGAEDREGAPSGVYSIRKSVGHEENVEGFGEGNILATYFHVHLANHPKAAANFVEAAARSRARVRS